MRGNGKSRMGEHLKREAYRSQLAKRSRQRLQVCLLLAVLGHIGAIGLLGGKSLLWFTKPEPAVVPVEFVDLAPVDLKDAEVDQPEAEANTIAPVDLVAGGIHQSDLSVGAGTDKTPTVSFASVQQEQPNPSHSASKDSSPVTSDQPTLIQTTLAITAAELKQWVTQIPASLNASVDRLFNPNRTQAQSPGVDAKRDRIWGQYDAALQRKIRANWRSIQVSQSSKVKVRLVLDRQGQLKDLKLLQVSGDEDANTVALEAVRSAAPFAPFPAEAMQDSLQVDFTFEYFAATN
ncbi:MAG TPA: TonB family protein [Allocoleopsis sp.]